MKPRKKSAPIPSAAERELAEPIRILGGDLRNRIIPFSVDARTRPMKGRVRKAVFDLLQDDVDSRVAIDLFAGTGALGLEALSRGANRAILIERHFPSAEAIRRIAAEWEIGELVTVVAADAFHWIAHDSPRESQEPWLLFCSPPYDFYVDRIADMLALWNHFRRLAPPGSVAVVESDERFDFAALGEAERWDVREYPPARVGVWR